MEESKARKAIEILKGIEEIKGNLPEDGNDVEEAFLVAIEALEKQLSKKPKENGMYRGIFKKIKAYTCPTCGNCCLEEMINERQNTDFCWNCGQRLDWSE